MTRLAILFCAGLLLTGCQLFRACPAPSANDTPAVDTPVPEPAGQLALVQFVDAVRPEDLEWLRAEGFTVVRVAEPTSSVVVRVPGDYDRNPLDNPRIVRFEVQMR